MLRLVIGGFLIAHGLVHAALWLPQAFGAPLPEGAPFDAGNSWLLSRVSADGARLIAGGVATMATLLLAAGGVGYLMAQDWWRWLAVSGGVTSLALIALYWHVWLSFGALLNVATIIAALNLTASAPET